MSGARLDEGLGGPSQIASAVQGFHGATDENQYLEHGWRGIVE